MNRTWAFALVLFGCIAYFNALPHPFVHDDVVFILKNPHITDLKRWPDAFKFTAHSDGINTYYRPVLELLYRLEYRLFGPNPFGFHLFNVIVHIINGLLLFGLLQKLGLRLPAAWLTALLFLIHPVQTEAVSCIAGISNLWMALGILLALHAYLERAYLFSLFFFIIAFLSKEQAIMFVPLLLVIDCYRKEINVRAWFGAAAAAGLMMWLRQAVTGTSVFKEITLSPGELYLRLEAIPRVIGMDLRLIFWPNDLHYYRSTDILQPNGLAWGLFLMSLLGIIFVFCRWSRVRPTLILGLGWFLVALFPVLNIAPLINEYSFILTPEHFLYLPIIGILIIVVAAAQAIPEHFCRASIKDFLLGLIAALCLLLTWHQNTFWRSETALFERMLRFEPNFGRGHLLLAKAYYFNGRPEAAEVHFEKAFMIIAGYAKKASNQTSAKFYRNFLKEVLSDWAHNDSAFGRWEDALDKYRKAAVIGGEDAALYNDMAFVYVHLGDKKDAYLSLRQALQIDPSFTQARSNLKLLAPDLQGR
jgi:tetratricopeptide (TPR) repeat protein